MNEITGLYSIQSDFEDRYHRTMSLDEFNFMVLQNCKTDLQRSICKDLLEVRPGWVSNIPISFDILSYITNGSVWGIVDATDSDLAKYLMEEHSVNSLDAAAAVGILHKHREEYNKRKPK